MTDLSEKARGMVNELYARGPDDERMLMRAMAVALEWAAVIADGGFNEPPPGYMNVIHTGAAALIRAEAQRLREGT